MNGIILDPTNRFVCEWRIAYRLSLRNEHKNSNDWLFANEYWTRIKYTPIR